MTEAQKTTLDLGAMMEQSLDEIPEAPDFNNPPAGEYRLSVKEAKIDTYTAKPKQGDAGGERQRLKLIYTIEQTVSTAGNEQPVPDGSMFSETFQGTEQGLSYFKKRVKEVMNVSDLNGVTLKDMMESVKGQAFDARITIKKTPNPNDANSPYENVNLRVVLPKAST
jgi:hypothetical protein